MKHMYYYTNLKERLRLFESGCPVWLSLTQPRLQLQLSHGSSSAICLVSWAALAAESCHLNSLTLRFIGYTTDELILNPAGSPVLPCSVWSPYEDVWRGRFEPRFPRAALCCAIVGGQRAARDGGAIYTV